MKVYRCDTYVNDTGEELVSWHNTEEEAVAHLRAHENARGVPAWGHEDVIDVDIPTDRAGLLKWLNRNLNRDSSVPTEQPREP